MVKKELHLVSENSFLQNSYLNKHFKWRDWGGYKYRFIILDMYLLLSH